MHTITQRSGFTTLLFLQSVRKIAGRKKFTSIVLLVAFSFTLFSCKCQKKSNAEQSTASTNNETENTKPSTTEKLTIGIVSHKYKGAGCSGVVVCTPPSTTDTLVLIPVPALTAFNQEGQKISFEYRVLRVRNPEGCLVGIPAELKNIKEAK